MLRGRFLKGLLKPPCPENSPFGDSRRWGDLSADLRTKLPASGRVERLRQKESRGNCPLVVAADTGLTSGEGVIAAMIGGRMGGGRGWRHSSSAACAATISTQTSEMQRRRGMSNGRCCGGRQRNVGARNSETETSIEYIDPISASLSPTKPPSRLCEMKGAYAGMAWGLRHSTLCSDNQNRRQSRLQGCRVDGP